jgi:hypothetical protein
MRTEIEAIDVVNDLGRLETIYRVRLFDVKRDTAGLHEVELRPRYVTGTGLDLCWSQSGFATRNGRRRYLAAASGPG